MDIVLEICDTVFFDRLYATVLPTSSEILNSFLRSSGMGANATFLGMPAVAYQYKPSTKYIHLQPSEWAYMSVWPRDNIFRQFISLTLMTWFFGLIVYFLCSTLSYIFVFDKTTFSHPKFLKNQIRQEISQSVFAHPFMSMLTAPFFVLEAQGHSKLYDDFNSGPGRWYLWAQFPFFILFTDCLIYFIHRALHHPILYRRLHKPHHKWIMPTPYASHAFHPVDGWMQSVPYHLFPFIFPMQKFSSIAVFVFVNIWTVFIHDGEYIANSPVINGAACHTLHHLYFNYNYGQFTTLWDRLGGSYRRPTDEMFKKETKMTKKVWEKQIEEMETMVKEVEGGDDRSYGLDGKKDQ
ncbi:MAG: c-5 sterol desaturase [Trichoglossum hirsutum]|nr:MAG: c-5 sterol desaturase [Trichoglossum hirsutum]